VSHTHNLPAKIALLKVRQVTLYCKGEEEELSEDKYGELHGFMSDIHSLSRLNTSICWQQSSLNWLRDGDANSKYFLSVLASRRRRNSLCSIVVDGVLVEGVQPVRNVVCSHFANHFRAQRAARPGIGHLQFRQLSCMEGGSLIKPFFVNEFKAVVWDCDSFKSPGPDAINLGFIKDFWVEMKDDIVSGQHSGGI